MIKDEKRKLDTTRTPEFLGLTKPGGSGPTRRPEPRRGRRRRRRRLDTGLWPENPSVARCRLKPVRQFSGTCQTGERWDASDCTQGDRSALLHGVTASSVTQGRLPVRLLSFPVAASDIVSIMTIPLSSTAGNFNVPVTVAGQAFGNASGMAPNARIAAYKICWGRAEPEAGCYTSDSVQAIEDATTDGADVINFSISGSRTSSVDAVEAAFFGAAQAGVFVSTSAGNDGPGAATVAHNTPWEMSVAAGTLDRANTKTVTLGDGQSFTGVSLGAAVPSSPVALSSPSAWPAGPDRGAALLSTRSTRPGHRQDHRVRPRRERPGGEERQVKRAGGVGMVLANTSPNSLNADITPCRPCT